jgi:hypothetical protein
MIQMATYLVKVHFLPPALMVNIDQIDIHLTPTRRART